MGTVVAVLLFAERSSSRRVLLAERSLTRRGRFAIRFGETLFVVRFADYDSFHVEDVD